RILAFASAGHAGLYLARLPAGLCRRGPWYRGPVGRDRKLAAGTVAADRTAAAPQRGIVDDSAGNHFHRDRSDHPWRGCPAPVYRATLRPQSRAGHLNHRLIVSVASFYSNERSAPSSHRIKHLILTLRAGYPPDGV